MNVWRMDLTVLTDLSASMFAVCFMILLVFLGLAQRQDTQPATDLGRIEASRVLRITRQDGLTPAAMVELLRSLGRPSAEPGIELFDDRIEVTRASATGRIVMAPSEIDDRLAELVPQQDGRAVRLYVFSNMLYNSTIEALGRANLRIVEISVPHALRDTTRPDKAWNAGFVDLLARSPDALTFRRELAELLDGSVEETSGFPKPAATAGDAQSRPDLIDRLRRWLSHLASVVFPIVGGVAVLLIERGRFRSRITENSLR